VESLWVEGRSQASETEAEMEGSGDDREPQGLAFLAAEFDKFHKTLNLTEGQLGPSFTGEPGDKPKGTGRNY
jgi:hypothetical protein